jgi:hypothetical protein
MSDGHQSVSCFYGNQAACEELGEEKAEREELAANGRKIEIGAGFLFLLGAAMLIGAITRKPEGSA